MMLPEPWRSMCGAAARMPYQVPTRSVSISSFGFSGSRISEWRPRGSPMPALLTITSIRPNSSTAAWVTASSSS